MRCGSPLVSPAALVRYPTQASTCFQACLLSNKRRKEGAVSLKRATEYENFLEAVPIGDGMQIGEENFLPGKEETRRNPDGFQEFLTQPDEKFSVKMRAGAYWYSFLASITKQARRWGCDVRKHFKRKPAQRQAAPVFVYLGFGKSRIAPALSQNQIHQ